MGIERDEFYVGERVEFDGDLTVPDDPNADLGTTVLTIQPPTGDAVTPAVVKSGTPQSHAHAEYVTVTPGWHEWRLESDGAVEAVRQGRFRVIPPNV